MLAVPAQAQSVCAPRSEVLGHLAKGYAEVPVARGLSSTGAVLEVLASPAGTWSVILTMPNGISCLTAAGKDWESPKAGPQPQGTAL